MQEKQQNQEKQQKQEKQEKPEKPLIGLFWTNRIGHFGVQASDAKKELDFTFEDFICQGFVWHSILDK